MASPLEIVLEMIMAIVQETITLLVRLFTLYGQLFQSVGVASNVGGPVGFLASMGLLAGVGYFVGKMILGGGKKLITLVVLGMIITFLIIAGLFT